MQGVTRDDDSSELSACSVLAAM